jgi:hypothetical protein
VFRCAKGADENIKRIFNDYPFILKFIVEWKKNRKDSDFVEKQRKALRKLTGPPVNEINAGGIEHPSVPSTTTSRSAGPTAETATAFKSAQPATEVPAGIAPAETITIQSAKEQSLPSMSLPASLAPTTPGTLPSATNAFIMKAMPQSAQSSTVLPLQTATTGALQSAKRWPINSATVRTLQPVGPLPPAESPTATQTPIRGLAQHARGPGIGPNTMSPGDTVHIAADSAMHLAASTTAHAEEIDQPKFTALNEDTDTNDEYQPSEADSVPRGRRKTRFSAKEKGKQKANEQLGSDVEMQSLHDELEHEGEDSIRNRQGTASTDKRQPTAFTNNRQIPASSSKIKVPPKPSKVSRYPRRAAQGTGEYHWKPCETCERVNEKCEVEYGRGACVKCYKGKVACIYSNSKAGNRRKSKIPKIQIKRRKVDNDTEVDDARKAEIRSASGSESAPRQAKRRRPQKAPKDVELSDTDDIQTAGMKESAPADSVTVANSMHPFFCFEISLINKSM